jgi:flagellar biosynthetic protein FliR
MPLPLPQFLPAELFAFLAVFTRLGAAFMVLPGFGEAVVPARIRLGTALAISLIVLPIVRGTLPPLPSGPGSLIAFLALESMIGFFIGGIARLLVTTLDTAGMLISTQIGLSSASIFNPALQTTVSLPSVLLSLGGLIIILETNLHHMLLEGLVDSYTLFKPAEALSMGDFSDTMARTLSSSFRVGLQIAMPFIILSLLFTFALGLISRLMPMLQVFFVSVPLQLVGGMLIILITLSAMLNWFLVYFQETYIGFLQPK